MTKSEHNHTLEEMQRLAHIGSWDLDFKTNQLNWSSEAYRIFEVNPKKFTPNYKNFLQLIHPDDRKKVENAYTNSLCARKPYTVEYRLLFSDGRIKYIHERCKTSFDNHGKPLRSLGTVQDITERKQAEHTSQKNEQRFQSLAELSPAGIFRTDTHGDCLYVNKTWREIAGMNVTQAQGKGWVTALHPEDRERVFREWINAAKNNLMPFRTECRFQRPDSKITWVLSQAHAERDINNVITGYVGTITDISETKNAEFTLHQIAETVSVAPNEQFFNVITHKLTQLFQVDYAFIALIDKQDPTKANTLSVCVKGETSDNVSYPLSKTPCENVVSMKTCIYPSGVQQIFPQDELLAELNIDSYIGAPLFDPQSEPFGLVVMMHSQPLKQPEQIQPIMEIVAARISSKLEHQRAEEEQYKSWQLLQTIFDMSPDMIFIHNTSGQIIEVNNKAPKVFGYSKEEICCANVQDLSGAGYTNAMALTHIHNALQNQFEEFEWVCKKNNGQEFPVEVRINRINQNPNSDDAAIIAVVRDISDRKKMDDAMLTLATRGAIESEFENFLQQALSCLTQLYNARYASIGRLIEPHRTHVQTLCVWDSDGPTDNFIYELKNTPCQDIISQKVQLISEHVAQRYADDKILGQMGVESYYGAPLIGSSNQILGLVSVMDTRPMRIENWTEPVLKVFAARLAAEIERNESIQQLRIHENNLEQLVGNRTRELEAFSYSVSHDLRAPLRTINGFSQIMLEDYASQLDNTGKDYLQRIRNASHRMGQLIDGLLKLSSINRTQLSLSQHDLGLLTEPILTQLREQHPTHQVKVNIMGNLHVTGDKNLLIIVLDNLLSNAWKYTGKTDQARIDLGMQTSNGKTVFYIRDNGIGFDMRYADKLFNPFQRLHGNEFAGTGIGLATVQRIIQRHGGKIWAKAEPNQGACFYFTLPKKTHQLTLDQPKYFKSFHQNN